MKVTLIFGFGNFFMVKLLFLLPEIWAHVGPRRSTRLEPNEVGPSLWGSFWSYLNPVNFFLKYKKIDLPYWKHWLSERTLKKLKMCNPHRWRRLTYAPGGLHPSLEAFGPLSGPLFK